MSKPKHVDLTRPVLLCGPQTQLLEGEEVVVIRVEDGYLKLEGVMWHTERVAIGGKGPIIETPENRREERWYRRIVRLIRRIRDN